VVEGSLFALAVTVLKIFQGSLGGASGGNNLKLRPYPIGELATEYWLRQEVTDAQAHALGTSVEIVARRYHDNRDFSGSSFVFKRAADLEAIHIGHHQVEENNVHRMLAYKAQAFSARDGFNSDKTLALKMTSKNRNSIGVVIHNHDPRYRVELIH
jgi:hypothetical protein